LLVLLQLFKNIVPKTAGMLKFLHPIYLCYIEDAENRIISLQFGKKK